MEETIIMMRSILTGKEKNQNEKELILQYQRTLLPNILAFFFTDNIGIINKTNNLYPILDSEDKASFCLQELDKCLRNFNLDNNNKFITYFIKCYKNRLRMETEQLLTHKRKALINYDEFDNEKIESLEYNLSSEIDFVLDSYNLTQNEKHFCNMIYLGYSIREIAKIVNINFQTLYKTRNQIKEKILLEM